MTLPIARGFWISPKGKLYKTGDHYTFLVTHPKLFGVSKNCLSGFDPVLKMDSIVPGTDETLAKLILKKKWIRVRSDGKNYSFNIWAFTTGTLSKIRRFLKELQFAPDVEVLIEEISTGKSLYKPAGWIIDNTASEYIRKTAKNHSRKKIRTQPASHL